jgi:sugar/nucleoside kinase (ribokinase family)
MFEVYYMDDAPIPTELEDKLDSLIREKAPRADLTVVNDFGHGMITPRIRKALEESAKFLALNTQTNSGNAGYNLVTNYRRADYIAIDAPEARLAARNKFGDLGSEVMPAIRSAVNCEHLIVTHGGHGCYVSAKSDPVQHIPAFTKTVVDTVGAGDAFFAITSPLASVGIPMELVGVIGNAAGALKVGIVGHRKSIEKVPLLKYLGTLLK